MTWRLVLLRSWCQSWTQTEKLCLNWTEQQKLDPTKTADECELWLKEARELIQKTLWSNFGHAEVSTTLQVAEFECDRAAEIKPDGNQEAYEFIQNHVRKKDRKRIKTSVETMGPTGDQKEMQTRVTALEVLFPRLVSRNAGFVHSEENQHRLDQQWLILRQSSKANRSACVSQVEERLGGPTAAGGINRVEGSEEGSATWQPGR